MKRQKIKRQEIVDPTGVMLPLLVTKFPMKRTADGIHNPRLEVRTKGGGPLLNIFQDLHLSGNPAYDTLNIAGVAATISQHRKYLLPLLLVDPSRVKASRSAKKRSSKPRNKPKMRRRRAAHRRKK